MSRFVFFSSCGYPWGGSEELWAGAAARLAEAGHSVSIFKAFVDPKHPRISRLLALGCHIQDLHQLCLPYWIRLPRSLVRLTGKRAAQRAIQPLLRSQLAALKPDLAVVSQGSNFDGVDYGDLCRASGLPYVMISQKATDYSWPPDHDRKIMRSAFQNSLRCYFVSQHNLQLTQCQIGQKLTNAEVVRNPFLVSGNVLSWPGAEDQSIKLACVARLETGEKGQDIVLQILAREPWRSRNLSVSFFGAGANREALRELAAHLGLNNVVFPGFVHDVESIWKTHHALILSSRTEGLPLVLVEAMMCGRVGIVTSAGGTGELLEEGRTGFIAQSATVDEFESAMERAWAAREAWESMGKAAATAVRAMVPLDPAACFSAKLLGLVESLQPNAIDAENHYVYAHKQSQ